MSDRNKRKTIRLPYSTRIQLKVAGHEWSGHVKDFSANGLLICLDTVPGKIPPRLTDQGIIIFQIEGIDMEIMVTVVRSIDNHCGVEFKHPF
ncbi:MAG: PilZ domain-containing protein [Magnetococcus sp. DMHC-1]